jgi:hypothetical protein
MCAHHWETPMVSVDTRLPRRKAINQKQFWYNYLYVEKNVPRDWKACARKWKSVLGLSVVLSRCRKFRRTIHKKPKTIVLGRGNLEQNCRPDFKKMGCKKRLNFLVVWFCIKSHSWRENDNFPLIYTLFSLFYFALWILEKTYHIHCCQITARPSGQTYDKIRPYFKKIRPVVCRFPAVIFSWKPFLPCHIKYRDSFSGINTTKTISVVSTTHWNDCSGINDTAEVHTTPLKSRDFVSLYLLLKRKLGKNISMASMETFCWGDVLCGDI